MREREKAGNVPTTVPRILAKSRVDTVVAAVASRVAAVQCCSAAGTRGDLCSLPLSPATSTVIR
jgi:hypothetical protein